MISENNNQNKKSKKYKILIMLLIAIPITLLIILIIDISRYPNLGSYVFEKFFSGPPASEYQDYLEKKYGEDDNFLYVEHSVSCESISSNCSREFISRDGKRFKVKHRNGSFSDQILNNKE